MFTPSHATVCVHYTTIGLSHVKHRWLWELQEINSILRKIRFPWILVSRCDSVNGAEIADLNSFEGLLRCKIEVGDIHKYYNFNCFKHRSWSWIFRYETAVTTCIVISYNYLLTNATPNYVNLSCKKGRISVILIGWVC